MTIWMIIGLMVVVIVGAGAGVALALAKARTNREFTTWQALADRMVADALVDGDAADAIVMQAQSTPVRNVFGRKKVALFSFNFTGGTVDMVAKLKACLAEQLVITDSWERDGVLHLDIALLVNDDTRGYVADIDRIQQVNG